jgi:aerobic-type carbon monoxide dehydrogenase small subunit (CoxS/CutS family)
VSQDPRRTPRFELTLNGEPRVIESAGSRSLLEVLREDLGLTGTKYGCGEGDCRACTVLIGGKPAVSCLTPLSDAAGKDVRTIEGLGAAGKLHPVQRAFLEADAMQCGYCVPGMILATVALLEKSPRPDDEAIVQALNGNLCRCAGYPNILKAVRIACGREDGARREEAR